MRLTKLLLYLFIFSIPLGQIVRIEFLSGSVALVPQDVLLLLLLFTWFIYTLGIKQRLRVPPFSLPLVFFFLVLTGSVVFSLSLFSPSEVGIGVLFLLRLLAYFMIYPLTWSILEKSDIVPFLRVFFVVGLFFVVIGFVQLFLLPDISFLTSYGWDPHVGRIVSSYLDPNFSGIYFILIFLLGLTIYFWQKNILFLMGSLLSLLAIIFTFSRSTYLALVLALILVGVLKSRILFLTFITLFLILSVFIPRVSERILGLLSQDETVQARVVSWQRAWEIFQTQPLLGVGFNNYRFAQKDLGLFSFDQPLGGHSGAGADSSFLTILATSGILGLISFGLFLSQVLYRSLQRVDKSLLAFLVFSAFSSLLLHSQFVNSLLFPSIISAFLIVLGLFSIEASNG